MHYVRCPDCKEDIRRAREAFIRRLNTEVEEINEAKEKTAKMHEKRLRWCRVKFVLYSRYIREEKRSMKEIARILGLSVSRVRSLEWEALHSLLWVENHFVNLDGSPALERYPDRFDSKGEPKGLKGFPWVL